MPPPDEEDEFDRTLRETGAGADQVDDFDAMAGELGVLPAEEPPAAARAPSGTGNSWLDSLIGGVEGLSLGRLRELGGFGALGHSGAGRMFDEHDKNAAKALETPAGQAGRAAGTVATTSALGRGAPGMAAQAALGAGVGANQAAEASDNDWLATLLGGATGAGFGALGGLVGQGLGALRAPSTAAATPLGKTVAAGATRGDEALAELAQSQPSLGRSIMHPWEAVKNYAGQGMIRGAMAVPESLPNAAGQVAAAGAGQLEGMAGRAHAQEPDIAYGTAPTMEWAVQSVLQGGNTGLEPADEQRLTEAALSGDTDKLISANFALSQRYPAYAARMRRELESLQEDRP